MATNKRLIKSNDDAAPVVPTSFNTVLWDGTGSSQSITGVGFNPEFIITKNRDLAVGANVFDVIRDNFTLYTSLTNAEDNFSGSIDISSANTDGFDLIGDSSSFNSNGKRYVAWCWKAGGAAVSVANGIGTSSITQSANVAAGFSITNYTGSVTGANKTIPHGLSTAPSMVIIKDRDWEVPNWFIWHQGLSGGDYYLTFTTAAQTQNSAVFSSAPTSSVVNLGIDSGVGDRTDRYIAYCFAEVAGFSKISSYVGNNGNPITIDVGFEPAFIMIKNTNTAGPGWNMYDNKRLDSTSGYNIFANSSNAEADYSSLFQMTSSGFTVTGVNTNTNFNNDTFIYMAFANQF